MEPRRSDPELLRFGIFELDTKSGELRKAGMKQKLAGQPFQVLRVLVERSGNIITREELRDILWPDNTLVDYDLAVKKAVNRVREVLGDSAESPRFIETIPRRGYRFLVEVRSGESTHAEPVRRQAPGKLAAGLAVLVTAGALLALNGGRLRTRISANSGPYTIRSIAVLPLENLSRDAGQEYFADGMTDALITDLAQLGSLKVISRTSSMQYKQGKKPLPQIARQLDVDGIVEGTVQRSGDRIRITAQLIEAASDRHLWAKSYERDAKDVLALQDEVARDIAGEIRVKLTPEERTRLADTRPVNPAAHEAYLRGRFLWNQRTEDQLHKAKQYFEEAVTKDPSYAPAYSGLADTYFYLSYAWGHIPPREGMPLARVAALKAIELDPSAAEGHASLAHVKFLYDWDFPGAEEEYKRAIALNPNYEMGHHGYSVLLAAEQRSEESISQARKAVEVDPLSVPANNILGNMLVAANRWDEAFAQSQKALELDPNPTHLAMFYTRIEDYYRQKGMTKEAIEAEFKSRAAHGQTPQEIEEIQRTYERFGRKGVVQRDLNQALKRWDKDHWHVDAYVIAMLYANLGDMESSFRWLEKCLEIRSTQLAWIYVGDTAWKKDPRFGNFQRKMAVHYPQ